MRSFNRTVLIGNVGADVVLRHTPSGKPVVNLSLATHARRKDDEDVTVWHRIVLWDRLAELAHRYVRKGQALYVEGPLNHRDWIDNQGVERRSTEITAREMIFLDQPGENAARSGPEGLTSKSNDGEELEEIVEQLKH